MKERSLITLLVAGLLVFGIAVFWFQNIANSQFTFDSAVIEFQGNVVRERLSFVPDKPYHTLYRNFNTPIMLQYGGSLAKYSADHILINSVECSVGTPYYKDYQGNFVSEEVDYPLEYTEANEFGCSFGSVYGFEKGREYFVSAEYVLNPKKLYEIEDRHYIRFVAYEKDLHPSLVNGESLRIDGDAVLTKSLFSGTDTIIYLPFEPENLEEYEILDIAWNYRWEGLGGLIIKLIVCILPAIACILVWLMFGREKQEGDYPSELSQYPKERKSWEVSALFNPPFGSLDRNFLPTIVLDFYSRKIIDIQFRKEGRLFGKELFIKIISEGKVIDETEKKVISFLKVAENIEKPKDGFFSISRASRKLSGSLILASYNSLSKHVLKKSKEYLDYKGKTILSLSLVVCAMIWLISGVNPLLAFAPSIITGIISARSSLFVRFKEDYYLEFQKWKGFRKYLSNSNSMRNTPPHGVVMWEKYLVYATALGVGSKVLKEMKQLNMIDSKEYDNYRFIYTANAFGSFSSSSGSSGGSGGGGGMGGGGIGGGGGGGR